MATVRAVFRRKKDGTKVKRFELSYFDKEGRRSRKLFELKRHADDERVRIENEIKEGKHVATRFSHTLKEACTGFLAHKESMQKAGKIERSTVRRYRTHIEKHITENNIYVAKLSDISSLDLQDFADELIKTKSVALAKKIFATLGMVFRYARQRKMIVMNPVEDVDFSIPRERKSKRITIPPKEDIKTLITEADKDATGRSGAMVRLMTFYGLRSSEVRGAGRQFIEFKKDGSAILKIAQRADEYNQIGSPKSATSCRDLVIASDTVLFIKRAMLARKAGALNLVFPNQEGAPIDLSKFMNRWWAMMMERAKLAKRITHENGKKLRRRKIKTAFTPHQLRHVAASMRIAMGFMPKEIQEFMGHSTLQMTMDTYGHLWKSEKKELENAEKAERFFL